MDVDDARDNARAYIERVGEHERFKCNALGRMFTSAELEEDERRDACPREREAGSEVKLELKQQLIERVEQRDACLQGREADSEVKLELKQQVKVWGEQRDACLQGREADSEEYAAWCNEW